jgi:hypothetical protein
MDTHGMIRGGGGAGVRGAVGAGGRAGAGAGRSSVGASVVKDTLLSGHSPDKDDADDNNDDEVGGLHIACT